MGFAFLTTGGCQQPGTHTLQPLPGSGVPGIIRVLSSPPYKQITSGSRQLPPLWISKPHISFPFGSLEGPSLLPVSKWESHRSCDPTDPSVDATRRGNFLSTANRPEERKDVYICLVLWDCGDLTWTYWQTDVRIGT